MRVITIISTLAISLAIGVILTSAQQQPTTARSSEEMVQNGDFESDLAGWSFVSSGDAKGAMRLVSENPLNSRSPHSIRLEVTRLGQVCGVANSGGPNGMNVQNGQWYDVVFCARKDDGGGLGLVFSLETADGAMAFARTTLPEIGRGGIGAAIEGNDQWKQYTVSLHAYASGSKCRLVITPIEPGTLYLDEVSVQPRKAARQ